MRTAPEFGDLAPHMTVAEAITSGCSVRFSVVRDIAQTEKLLFDDQALMTRPGRIGALVISSTLSPQYIRSL